MSLLKTMCDSKQEEETWQSLWAAAFKKADSHPDLCEILFLIRKYLETNRLQPVAILRAMLLFPHLPVAEHNRIVDRIRDGVSIAQATENIPFLLLISQWQELLPHYYFDEDDELDLWDYPGDGSIVYVGPGTKSVYQVEQILFSMCLKNPVPEFHRTLIRNFIRANKVSLRRSDWTPLMAIIRDYDLDILSDLHQAYHSGGACSCSEGSFWKCEMICSWYETTFPETRRWLTKFPHTCQVVALRYQLGIDREDEKVIRLIIEHHRSISPDLVNQAIRWTLDTNNHRWWSMPSGSDQDIYTRFHWKTILDWCFENKKATVLSSVLHRIRKDSPYVSLYKTSCYGTTVVTHPDVVAWFNQHQLRLLEFVFNDSLYSQELHEKYQVTLAIRMLETGLCTLPVIKALQRWQSTLDSSVNREKLGEYISCITNLCDATFTIRNVMWRLGRSFEEKLTTLECLSVQRKINRNSKISGSFIYPLLEK